MIFTPEHVELIKQGRKTQTRRLARDDEYGLTFDSVSGDSWVRNSKGLKWRVGRTYAVQPGRTKPGIPEGRIRITGIRRERLWDITEQDAIAEGCVREDHLIGAVVSSGARVYTASYKFERLWNSINTRKGTGWKSNPEVWVLEFEWVPA